MARDSSAPAPSSPSDDALTLFEVEGERQAAPGRGSQPPSATAVVLPMAHAAAAAPASGWISLDRIRSIGPLRFVEAVAIVQAACEKASPRAGIPELSGIFLAGTGEIMSVGSPSTEPAARQAARLLHQLVSPELTPPAGRLFIGRWTGSDSRDLSDFVTELAYFARPNGSELRAAIHAHTAANPALGPMPVSAPAAPIGVPPMPVVPATASREEKPAESSWFHDHRRQVIGATAVVAAVLASGLTVWMWPSTAAGKNKEASAAVEQVQQETRDESATPTRPTAGPPTARPGARTPAARTGNASPTRTRPPERTNTPSTLQGSSKPEPAEAGVAAAPLDATQGPLATVTPATRDSRIYTEADSGVEPPQLRSAEIPEWLIRGFDTRQNNVEVLIDERGEVQQARMVGSPQRLPDVMLLSRVKEWLFTPATKNGVPVRYRMRLSWSVTP